MWTGQVLVASDIDGEMMRNMIELKDHASLQAERQLLSTLVQVVCSNGKETLTCIVSKKVSVSGKLLGDEENNSDLKLQDPANHAYQMRQNPL